MIAPNPTRMALYREGQRLRRHKVTLSWPGGTVTGYIERQQGRVTVAGRRVLWVVSRGGRVDHPYADDLIAFARAYAAFPDDD